MIIQPIIVGGKDPEGLGFYRAISGEYVTANVKPFTFTIDCGFIPTTLFGIFAETIVISHRWGTVGWASEAANIPDVFTIGTNQGSMSYAFAGVISVSGNTFTLSCPNLPTSAGFSGTVTLRYCIIGKVTQ